MNIPIQFPDNAEIIAEEAARFRALSPEQRVRTFDEMFELYTYLTRSSDRPDALARVARDEEENERQAIREFAARHA